MKLIRYFAILCITSVSFNINAESDDDKQKLGDSPFTSKQSIVVVANCGVEPWVPGPIDCPHGYYTRSAKVSSKNITKAEPGLFFVYQSAAYGPECTIPFTSGGKKVVVYFQQNFGSTKSGAITLKVNEGAKYVTLKKAFRGSYRDDIPGVGMFCLDSSK